MAFVRIIRPPNVTPREYDAVNDQMGLEGAPPPGLLLHRAGELDRLADHRRVGVRGAGAEL